MKSIVLSLITLAAFSANAQNLRAHTSGSENLRLARQQMERQTEQTIVEKLEEQRMEDEKRRLRQFESLNFSVVAEQIQTAVAPVSQAQVHMQTVQAQTAQAQQTAAPTQAAPPVSSQEVTPVVIAPGYN
ncbi:hypothetical protein [Bdellovibrio sp. HCB2-146]|uniref:hypothetical protein n=1 Tax=Bdellovibrio sp. HCB2-146 TaxID=3394362 RepID=UPI0039BC4777